MSHKIKEIIKSISVDCVIFGYESSTLEVLLIRRAIEPASGMWALPGGFVKKGERIHHAAKRVLYQTTGVSRAYLEEIGVFDAVGRYPRWRVFTVGHVALISPDHYAPTAGSDTSDIRWVPINRLPKLPFDHKTIIGVALEKLRKRVRSQPIGFEIFPVRFTLPQLQRLYEVILGRSLDKRNFRKKILAMHFVKKLSALDTNGTRRPASYYAFNAAKYARLKDEGFEFGI